MNDTSVVGASDLRRTFGEGSLRVEVLRGVNLEVVRGESVAILGASGSGKSTLLHLLGGLDLPTSGCVRVMGRVMNDLGEGERGRLRNRAPRIRVPVPSSAPGVHRARQCRDAALREARAHGPGTPAGGRGPRPGRALAAAKSPSRGSSRGASASAPPSPGRSPAGRRASWPTSRRETSTATRRGGVCDLMFEINREEGTSLVVVTHDLELAERADRRLQLGGGRFEDGG